MEGKSDENVILTVIFIFLLIWISLQNLFNVDFALDYSLPYENQSWRVKYKRKAEILNAIQNSK